MTQIIKIILLAICWFLAITYTTSNIGRIVFRHESVSEWCFYIQGTAITGLILIYTQWG